MNRQAGEHTTKYYRMMTGTGISLDRHIGAWHEDAVMSPKVPTRPAVVSTSETRTDGGQNAQHTHIHEYGLTVCGEEDA